MGFGKPKAQGPSKQQIAADRESQRINREMLALAQRQAEAPLPSVPEALPAAPAPTTSSADVQRASDDARLQSGKRRGLRQTILTGDTGGYKAPSTLGGGGTLLS